MLDEPLLIDGSKELKIGIKVHDYDAEQIPLLYAVSDKFIAGKSDLFSEDNGATWQKVSEFTVKTTKNHLAAGTLPAA